ncbi:3-oxoacyl-[acyl-carrier-protein] synthase II [Micromonospora matsumotoense]|uniref:3-oxoacyl-[acyl-carrier-protein] synthase II n=2 Tax=Micromonospora matsumotoense TaxID=121616 RepID=A0A1C5AX08_9ACTN|nr:beta-ketoacyl-[acyl-carrier-protein] synthase family protein [Micromonospora matsumotoense]SCF49707.1 3-oxoacyl-[acyl-carrier-protein] synthase II [Micromonospora matsumotoense]
MAVSVAVTGLGLVSPAGIGLPAGWDRVCAGEPTADHDPILADGPVTISCRVPDFDGARLLGPRAARRLDRFVQLALVAAREAVADAGLDHAGWDGARVGVVLGNTAGGTATVEQQSRVLLTEGPAAVLPQLLPMHLANMLAGTASIELGALGPSLTVATACASGATAIGLARDLLLAGRCDVVVTGGSEAMITPLEMAGFAQMRALSRRNADPRGASRPFDVDRDGFVAGEGAGILILEREADASARGARVRARIAGFGASADAHHVTAPDPSGRGIELALRAALADAGAAPGDVDHVNAHGTSTPLNDVTEAGVLRRVLGGADALVTSTKGVTGHCLGAAGAVEAVLTVRSIEEGLVPPTANLTTLDPAVDLAVAVKPTPRRIDLALSNSFGFGGQNAVLAVSRA